MKKIKLLFLLAIGILFNQCQSSTSGEQSSNETAEVKTLGSIERLDSSINEIIKPDAQNVILAEGFSWSEGPVWVPSLNALLFTDVPENTIYKWSEEKGNEVFISPSGYTGIAPTSKTEGANGLALDKDGNLLVCQHGDRRLAYLAKQDVTKASTDFVNIVDDYQGKRFNSPNDVIVSSRGDIYFTDPPYGLAGQDQDSLKELSYNGVFKLSIEGELTLLTDELSRPNGLAFSPDEKTLYVANSDAEKAIWMAYDITEVGLSNGRVFFDATEKVSSFKGLPDGLKVNKDGVIFATGPGGVFVFSKEGNHLGTILTEVAPANCAFNEDESVLYITAHNYLTTVAIK